MSAPEPDEPDGEPPAAEPEATKPEADAKPEVKADARPEVKADAKPKAKPDKAKGRGAAGTDAHPLEIELEGSRQRSASWAIIGGTIGGLLIWKLGTVGVWGGIVLVVIAAFHAWNLVQSFLNPPGTIVVTDREVTLPRGLNMSRPLRVARSEITAVYFLRRSVPWNHAAPVLVIELGENALAFPRDWFATEADQRHIIHALLRDKNLASEPAA